MLAHCASVFSSLFKEQSEALRRTPYCRPSRARGCKPPARGKTSAGKEHSCEAGAIPSQLPEIKSRRATFLIWLDQTSSLAVFTLEKLGAIFQVDPEGLEPSTSSMQTRRASRCAMGPSVFNLRNPRLQPKKAPYGASISRYNAFFTTTYTGRNLDWKLCQAFSCSAK